MKSKRNLIIMLFILLSVSIYIIVQQSVIIKNLKQRIPILVKGEKISYFDLIDSNNQIIDGTTLKKNSYTIFFIFEQPCSTCNDNIIYWKKIKSLVKDKIPVFGIIPNSYENMIEFSRLGGVNFRLFSPINRNKFITEFRLSLNIAQTVLLKGDEIKLVKIGKLKNTDFTEFLSYLKKIPGIRR